MKCLVLSRVIWKPPNNQADKSPGFDMQKVRVDISYLGQHQNELRLVGPVWYKISRSWCRYKISKWSTIWRPSVMHIDSKSSERNLNCPILNFELCLFFSMPRGCSVTEFCSIRLPVELQVQLTQNDRTCIRGNENLRCFLHSLHSISTRS